jgi:hypothetical protein
MKKYLTSLLAPVFLVASLNASFAKDSADVPSFEGQEELCETVVEKMESDRAFLKLLKLALDHKEGLGSLEAQIFFEDSSALYEHRVSRWDRLFEESCVALS